MPLPESDRAAAADADNAVRVGLARRLGAAFEHGKRRVHLDLRERADMGLLQCRRDPLERFARCYAFAADDERSLAAEI